MSALVAELRAAGALSAAQFEPGGSVRVLMPSASAGKAAELLKECPLAPHEVASRTEKSVVTVDDEGREVVVHVGVVVELADALTACVKVVAEQAGGLDRVDAYVEGFRHRAHGREIEEARLEHLAMMRLDEGEFGAPLGDLGDGVGLAVGLLLADYVCDEELPTMGHCVEAVMRHRDVLSTAEALSKLDDAERARLVRVPARPAEQGPAAARSSL